MEQSAKNFQVESVVDSICEAEYIAVSDAAKEAVWLRKFIDEIEMAPFIHGPVLLYCDNAGAIAPVKELRSHLRTKHILHRYHLIREIVDRGDVDLQKIDGRENLANSYTKALEIKQFDDHKSKMGIQYYTDWL